MKKVILSITIIASVMTGCSTMKVTKSQEILSAEKALKSSEQKSKKRTEIKLLEPKIVESNKIYVAYINEIRQKGSKCAPPTKTLIQNGYLDKAAFAHANDMATTGKLTHLGSGTATDISKSTLGVGSVFFERILFFGYPAAVKNLVGENITFVSNKFENSSNRFNSFKRAVSSFIAEPTHCKILMEPRFNDVGIGYNITSKGIYWVLDFAETSK